MNGEVPDPDEHPSGTATVPPAATTPDPATTGFVAVDGDTGESAAPGNGPGEHHTGEAESPEAFPDETAAAEVGSAEPDPEDAVAGQGDSGPGDPGEHGPGERIPGDDESGEAIRGDAAAGEDDPEQDAGGERVLVADELPDLSTDEALDAALETLLLVVDAPVTEETLGEALEVPTERVEHALRRLAGGYTEHGRGIDLRRAGEGWRFYTRDTYAPYVEKFLMDGQRAKLTRAALETLAVIAYRQPVTRSRVAAVRGVNVDGVIRTLLARGLVQEAGTDTDTGGTLYATTELFLERLGLSGLDELPPLAPLLPEVDSIDDV